MDLNDKQKKIIEVLKKEELATTKIAFSISANLYQTEVYLEELYEKGIILFVKKNNATYWRLKDGR